MALNKKKLPQDLKSRLCAVDVLKAILLKKQPFDTTFNGAVMQYSPMEPRDIGFARTLIMTVLRQLGRLDAILKTAVDRDLKDIDPVDVLMLLRIGLVQILFMDVKDHAAVDTVVRGAAALDLQKQKGFINGVLRTLLRQRETVLSFDADEDGKLNTPEWLYKLWVKDYGAETALKIANAHMQSAPVDITLKSTKDLSGWAQKLGGQALVEGSVRLKKAGRIPDLDGYDEGSWWVQSSSAALPVRLMAQDLSVGAHVVDLCAAPGGKTMQLAAAGFKTSAVDISRNRLKRIHENLERCGLTAEVEAADGKVWKPKRPVDAVLVDAPCTATGTIRHQPDVTHLKKPQDMTRLIETQKEILKNAASFVKKGGQILYCTCSLQKAESEAVTESFVAENSKFSLAPYTVDDVPWLSESVTKEGYIRILPHHAKENGGMDGFFIARLIRS